MSERRTSTSGFAARVTRGLLTGGVFGLTVGFVVGSLLGHHNALPSPGGAYWRLVLFSALIYTPVFAGIGLVAGLVAPLTRLSVGGVLAGAAGFLFSGFVVNARYPVGPLDPPAVYVNVGLALGALGLAVLVTAVGRRLFTDGHPPVRPAMVFALLIAIVIIAACWTGTIPEREWDSARALPPAGSARVALIGIDGMTWSVARPLMEQGRMPVLSRLVEQGASGDLESYAPCASPLIWTTMVTGKDYRRHGVTKFEGWRVPFFRCGGLDIPTWSGVDKAIRRFPVRAIQSGDRRTNALWNVLSEAGWSVGFSSWWASYPVEPVNGFNITDQFTFVLKSYRKSGFAYLEEAAGIVHPDSLTGRLIPTFASPDEITETELARFARVDPGDLERIRNLAGWEKPLAGDRGFETPDEFFLGALVLPYLDDLSRTRMFIAAYEEYRPDVVGFYIRGIDDVQHHFWHFREPERFARHEIPEDQMEKFGHVIESYYTFTDSLIGSVLDTLAPGTQVFLVSDHGAVASGTIPWSGTHFTRRPPPGVLVASGPGIQPGTKVAGASVYDVMPTLLRALGFPTAEDHDGRVLETVFSDKATSTAIESYDSYFHSWKLANTTAPANRAIDEEMHERLRALGYVH